MWHGSSMWNDVTSCDCLSVPEMERKCRRRCKKGISGFIEQIRECSTAGRETKHNAVETIAQLTGRAGSSKATHPIRGIQGNPKWKCAVKPRENWEMWAVPFRYRWQSALTKPQCVESRQHTHNTHSKVYWVSGTCCCSGKTHESRERKHWCLCPLKRRYCRETK